MFPLWFSGLWSFGVNVQTIGLSEEISSLLLVDSDRTPTTSHLFSNSHHTIPATCVPLASTSNRNVYATFSTLVNPFADQYVGDDVGIPSNCVPIDTSGFDVILSENKFLKKILRIVNNS